jgi:hypothetical protein
MPRIFFLLAVAAGYGIYLHYYAETQNSMKEIQQLLNFTDTKSAPKPPKKQ